MSVVGFVTACEGAVEFELIEGRWSDGWVYFVVRERGGIEGGGGCFVVKVKLNVHESEGGGGGLKTEYQRVYEDSKGICLNGRRGAEERGRGEASLGSSFISSPHPITSCQALRASFGTPFLGFAFAFADLNRGLTYL